MIRSALYNSRRNGRRGLTLVELLVVVAIVLLLMAIAIPAMAPALANRQIVEGADLLNTYIRSARARAIERGSPVGVMLERLPGVPQAATVVSYAIVPAPYSGDTFNSRIFATAENGIDFFDPAVDNINLIDRTLLRIGVGDLWDGLVQVGDLIRFNYQKPDYVITFLHRDMTTGAVQRCEVAPADPTLAALPVTQWPKLPLHVSGASYQVFRQPVKSPAASLVLRDGVVVDLEASGVNTVPDYSVGAPAPSVPDTSESLFYPRHAAGENAIDMLATTMHTTKAQQQFVLEKPIIIMFDPDGSLGRVYRPTVVDLNPMGAPDTVWRWRGLPVRESVHLLVGARENVVGGLLPPSPPDENLTNDEWHENWRDLRNQWIMIDGRTGQSNIAPVAPWNYNPMSDPNPQTDRLLYMLEGIRQSRSFASDAANL